jgi:uncharacterized protein (TIGR03118 family)
MSHHGDTVSPTDLGKGLGASATPRFIQHNLISDGAIPARTIDPNLINPWGVSFSPTSPFWISDNGAGLSSIDALQHGNVMLNVRDPVTIPSPSGDTSAPTGQVFNSFATSDNAFVLSDGKPATFLFATEDGTIAGWNPDAGNTAMLPVDNSSNTAEGDATLGIGAVYKGLAIGMVEDGSNPGPRLYAANFSHGTVDMFDKSFNQVGSITAADVPAGYAPFNVQVLDDKLYVTFAKQDSMKHDDLAGAGHGFVDVFDLNGKEMAQVGAGGNLNSPWGLAIAPSSFGSIAGDLLVGNFGDGRINIFNQNTDTSLGQLEGPNGRPITIDGLWSLTPGNGGSAGNPNTIYFTAGPNGEQDGLFGSLSVVPNHGANSGNFLG